LANKKQDVRTDKTDSLYEQKKLEEKNKIMFERLSRVILQNMNSSIRDTEVKIKSYSKEDIRKFNENPDRYQRQLMELSNYLYIISPQYRRLINHFSLMPTFDTHIIPYAMKDKPNKKTFKLAYNNISEYLEFMNLKYEIPKIMINCFKEDTFYGYVYETADTFFIRKLPVKYCAISSIENGLLVFQFDFLYFNGKPERLEEFGDEFKIKFKKYQENSKLRWQELDLKNTVCFKVNDDELTYSTPPFSGVFESVIEIDEFRKYRLNKERINNYKIIFEKIPMDSKSTEADSFLISIEEALKYHSMTASAIDDSVGLALTPFEIDTVDFKSDTADTNRVNDAIESFWNGAGVAANLMGSDTTSGNIIQMSIKNDEAISFRLLRQIEKWINYRISGFNTSSYKFKMEFIESTVYNVKELISTYKEMAMLGFPIITRLSSLLGVAGEEVSNMNYLESTVLELDKKFKPLQSSSTISSEQNGRPVNDSTSDSKQQTSDDDTNANRVE